MTLRVNNGARATTIEVVGRLDSVTSPVLEKMIEKIASGTRYIVLELSGVEYVSDVGLKVLLRAHESLQTDGSLKLLGVRDSVMEIFKANGFADTFTIAR